MKTLTAGSVDQAQLDELDRFRAHNLPAQSELADALTYVIEAVRQGTSVTVIEDDARVTPAQAAKLLGMSRTHLYKLLDQKVIPCITVGERDRRITIGALRAYQSQMDADNVELAERFAHKDRDRATLAQDIADR
ncbi:helix-turn-helix domain-containing protein [Tsukamurella pulmonis]|uniref:helix-turn-helix domain-containing protein n=1 Tax=Tsukamurella pulmonis TaxID=47312 RepID=UPI000E093FF8|nr:helix-turn-helix domain-containing protein [Tsukamurella pulmonis]RDH13873.1 DNA-binding protein [Tsukamurella pulmonis]